MATLVKLDMMPPPTAKPAITHGQPRVTLRWWRSFAMTWLLVAGSGVVSVLLDWNHGGPERVLLIVAWIIGTGAVLWYLELLYRWFSILRALGRVPPACFNCLYPMPGLPVCPECGRRQNYEDLSKGWKKWFAKRRYR